MKILMLSPTLPWPLNLGARIRIYHTLRELARAGHEVALLCLSEELSLAGEAKALEPYCHKLEMVSVKRRPRTRAALKALLSPKPYRVAKFESAEFRRRVAELLHEPFDILWVHFLETLAYLPELKGRRRPLVVLDQHNADERFWATYAREGPPWIRLFAWQNLWKLRRFQQKALQHVDVVLSVSEEDAAFTRTRLPNPSTKVWVVPNGVDTEQLRPGGNEDRRDVVIFVGSMDIFMNIDAVGRFAQEIFPKVREVIPQAEFWIVGRNPASRVRALEALPGVRVTGSVDDVRPYYAQSKVAVAPFRYGGGTKLKVLEAMALGVPVVATPIGCQGIKATHGQHLFIFIEEETRAFTQQVIHLLRDDELRRRTAVEARRLVEERYSWKSILKEPIRRLEGMLGESDSGSKFPLVPPEA